MGSDKKIRILVVDDHEIVRAGIIALFKTEKDFVVVGEASNGADAVAKTKELTPDIVLMDLTMPEMDGTEATRAIKRLDLSTHILILTQHEHEEYLRRVLAAGAAGYIVKNSLASELLTAIRMVSRGEKYFDATTSRLMTNAYTKIATGRSDSRPVLTKREREILQFIAEGYTNQQTADKLHISVRTVEFHRANLLQKLGLRDTASLVKYAIQENIISLD